MASAARSRTSVNLTRFFILESANWLMLSIRIEKLRWAVEDGSAPSRGVDDYLNSDRKASRDFT